MADVESRTADSAVDAAAVEIQVADSSVVTKYIEQLVPVLLEDNSAVVPIELKTLLSSKNCLSIVKKFASDPNTKGFLISRTIIKEDDDDEQSGKRHYSIHPDVTFSSPKQSCVTFMKRGDVLEADKPINSQIRILNFTEGSPYENLHSYVANAISPFFKSYIRVTGKADRDGDKMAASVEKKIVELEMGLLHLQQNIDIPEITLTINPAVQAAVAQAKSEQRTPRVGDLGDRVDDSSFLNILQNGVNRWIREIQKVTKLNRDPSSGTALQEISFWLNLERALLRIQEKREGVEILLTLDILKHGKRFLATLSFDTDTGLKQALATVNDYNPLMKDFPLNDLLASTELEKIKQSLVAIFTHLRKIRNTKYPISRCFRLVEAISRDLSSQMLKVLGTRRLMHISYDEFDKLMTGSIHVFSEWEDEFERLQQLLREIAKKKRDETMKMTWRANPSHKKLQSRLEQLRKFRKQHEQLRTVIVRVLRSGGQQLQVVDEQQPTSPDMLETSDANAIEEVNIAYENVKEVDVLDLSKEGTEAWEAAIKRYDERIDRVETRITARLRDQLGTARNANEMFRIFSRFNALFVRPHIMGAIREYQTQLIARVKEDIESLHIKFKQGYPNSKSSQMSRVRDLPPVSGSIIWARQIERQLSFFMKRVEDVLGKGWENHVEGQKLKGDSDSFRKKLSTQEVFDDWVQRTQQKQLVISGKIYYVESVRARASKIHQLRVNFAPEIIQLSKEVRNLKWLGYRVPLGIMNKAHQANQLYPFAISLIESIKTYDRTNVKVDERSNIVMLVAGLKREIQSLITEGGGLTWESYKLDPYVQRLGEAVSNYQEKVSDLVLNMEKIDNELIALDSCRYDQSTFIESLSRIQNGVDELNLYSYSNLPQWVAKLDKQVEEKLASRLQAGIKAWENALIMDTKAADDDSDDNAEHPYGGDPVINICVYEFKLRNQVIYFHPSVPDVRKDLFKSLHDWESLILDLPRIQSQRYQVGLERDLGETTYRKVMSCMPGGSSVLLSVYTVIEKIMTHLTSYVNKWVFFQSLWDLTIETVEQRIGLSLDKWMQLLAEIKNARSTFDTAETMKTFGAVKVDFGKVQPKVSLKYDSIHKDLLSRFGNLLNDGMQELHNVVGKSRGELEVQSIDTASTSEAVEFITYMQSVKRKVKNWDKEVELYREGQKLLEKQRYQFPPSWLHVDNIEGEWGAFNEILKRKDQSIQGQVGQLQMKIIQEDKQVESRTGEILLDWDKCKPVGGDLRPEDASTQLAIYETKFQRLKEDRQNLIKAKEALDLHDPGHININEEKMVVALEELHDLKVVWLELSKVWDQIDGLKEQTWLSINPRKIRQQLDTLTTQLKGMPSKLRQYASFEHIQSSLKQYTKANVLITELKSDALKERHWKTLMRKLGVNWVLSELTLGHVWAIDLIKNETTIRDVLSVAQGETALEEFLKQVRDCWHTYELELINYQNKCNIIRGWDDLFNKVKEHINNVAAMKVSPYYKVFEDEALSWEEKLNRINGTFDVWIDVQRRWVYLEGIFTGSADIQHLLPVETQRFQSISSEFLTLMKKVSKTPLVVDVVNIQGVQRQLERLADLLAKIQKALGEYLERQRSSFPRFYFVGDEDLLEIIGHAKSIDKVQKHVKKMFAGINTFITNKEDTLILGMTSRQGEEVFYKTPVDLPNRKINDWLTMAEQEMRVTLAKLLAQAVEEISSFQKGEINAQNYIMWVDKYQAQLVTLASQIAWSENVERALKEIESAGQSDLGPLEAVLQWTENSLNILADSVLMEQPLLLRQKLEHLITEMVHKRDVTRRLIKQKLCTPSSFDWLSELRFYFNPKEQDVLKQLSIHIANARFNYGFEYLGVQDKLVQTPLTDRCYLTMTQALEGKFGGSPFGPAGTGKTETVKALGNQMGRFVLVFNCDETFDFQAMGRIFVGLCQVGAWGCFDEFNRLEERMLSACSQQIQAIQECLKEQVISKKKDITVDLVGKSVKVNSDMAIFITMNPGYAGRSNLPDNLKKLFRSLAMTKPNRHLIAQVMLYSQGFRMAEVLASKMVPLFQLCDEQLSNQSHYDFGLRSLKSVLISAGHIKREKIQHIRAAKLACSEEVDEAKIAETLPEQEILIQAVCHTMVPKLISDDIPLLFSLLSDVFPGIPYVPPDMGRLQEELIKVCNEKYLMCGQEGEMGTLWMEKVLQLYQISNINHGLMLVGPSGSGKSMAWRMLLKALERVEGVQGVAHIIDPKAISKDDLYGNLDPNTREWSDGLFTSVLRRIIDNVRGELGKRQWIIFDGDVDPEWVENLNSVLDDNKLLTLPNGERLGLPPNVRIIFEVQDLKYATLATVSRCGMLWFSDDILTLEMIFQNYLRQLKAKPVNQGEDEIAKSKRQDDSFGASSMKVQAKVAELLQPHFSNDGLVIQTLIRAETLDHIMEFTKIRALTTLFSSLNQMVRNVIKYNDEHPDFPLPSDQLEKYISKGLIYHLVWSLSGDCRLQSRTELCEHISSITTIQLPPCTAGPIIDFEVSFQGDWVPWQNRVPVIEVETHKVGSPDVVVPTLDTVRHENLLYTWLAEHKPLLLCGPPGSGKTMTLFSALRALPDIDVVGLNFSSATTPELIMKTFDHYCEYSKTPNGLVLRPSQIGKWIVVFCDEINLPDMDKYGTIRVIMFIRQMVEHGGFYRKSDMMWVSMERIQFVGACNPPTDPGRKPLTQRFLRHVPVVCVDCPGPASLRQIYGTFNRALLRMIPSLKPYSEPLTEAMVEFFTRIQETLTVDLQPHYVYSPREMTRWVRGICEALKPLESLSVEGLIRIWAHEGLRLFQDRLVASEERQWTDDNLDDVALSNFPGINQQDALQRPILYSNWLSKDYVPVERIELRDYVNARLRVFHEEELDVPLVLFNEVLDHVLRIDRVFRQIQGHMLIIGIAGAGKTTLSRFVAWMNGLSVVQVKVHNKYTMDDFDDDLRAVLRRSGCKGEKICFILDESNVLDSSFLERINTLLANGEVPGLFEGDENASLMTQCKEGSQRDGKMLDSNDELYKWFTQQVMKNLHVVFTMNPSVDGLKDRAATSPALFNRCVMDWFGDWSTHAYHQVGKVFTSKVDLEKTTWKPPSYSPVQYDEIPPAESYRDAINTAFVYIHKTLHTANIGLTKRGLKTVAITPRHFLDFINHYVALYAEKRSELEEQQLHLNVGLQKIRETVNQVQSLQKSLNDKSKVLTEKELAANSKLKQMVKDQQEAEQQKVASKKLQGELIEQTKVINVRREAVMKELSEVEPAVEEAKSAVKGIKKSQLDEVRKFPNPPVLVKLAMESICLLLGEKADDWKQIKQLCMKDTFIPSIVNFDTESITDELRHKMDKYIKNPDYNFEKINRASQACGPLVKWASAQIRYSNMLNQVDPMRQELQRHQAQAKVNKDKVDEMAINIVALEKSITGYKEEYAALISEAQIIKADAAACESKVVRSVALLTSLSSEKIRWELSSESFKYQMQTIIGDVLLSSAFMAYAGYFEQNMRENLFKIWTDHLQQWGIDFKSDLSLVEYLSTADERIQWQSNALPADDLCTENAIMLKRYNRYPLVIDPSGQATSFIQNEYRGRKIVKTSFLDDSFRKNLESALRFGSPLLVQDVESYDPILNPVLNKEVKRTGGRVLITIGDTDIDLSPSFVIFMSTRDPTADFPADLCSRVTFINFTVTRASLQSQCLNTVLKAERPDVDEKRSDLLKLQGEFKLKLRHLEKALLKALNECQGNILDDDKIIATLETLKKEAADVQRKVEETDEVMAEVETVSEQYLPLSQGCSSIYFALESLHQIHFLYQYSLQFFLEIFHAVLYENKDLKGVTDCSKRLAIVTQQLFLVTFARVSRTMLHKDRISFAMALSRIHMKQVLQGDVTYDTEFHAFLKGSQKSMIRGKVDAIKGFSTEQCERLATLKTIPAFTGLNQWIKAYHDEFKCWTNELEPEKCVPECWDESKPLNEISRCFLRLLMVQATRPDRVLAASNELIRTVMGERFIRLMDQPVDLANIVANEIKPATPILMCCETGYDASSRIDDLAADNRKQMSSIALGSGEGFTQAEKAISSSSKSGRWVLLKNVHLAPQWLVSLEKKLHSLQPHSEFRLFLTMEISPKLPSSLLRTGRVITFEAPPGIKANLTRTFSDISSDRMCKPPNERARLYFVLAWFHAIVQERLRYAPLGWSKKYEFSDSDLRCACDTLDTWLDGVSKGRANIAPEKVPWNALRTLLGQSIYGGKIDNQFDQRLLVSFLNKLFTPSSFESEFALVRNVDGQSGKHIVMPDGFRRDSFSAWVDKLPDSQTPSWLGLPNNAERLLLTKQGVDLTSKLQRMQMVLEADDPEEQQARRSKMGLKKQDTLGDGRPAWMRQLAAQSREWLTVLPTTITGMNRTPENIKDPLFRFFEREVNSGKNLLRVVLSDLDEVHMVCDGKKKQTNILRSLIDDLAKGIVPSSWLRYKVAAGTTVMVWLVDFSERVRQLDRVSKATGKGGLRAIQEQHVWLGGLFTPGAYITATRQFVAQANDWSLEELSLSVRVSDSDGSDLQFDASSFAISGLKLIGAQCRNNTLSLCRDIETALPLARFQWVRTDSDTLPSTSPDQLVNLPVYLNQNRQILLFTLDFETSGEGSGKNHSFYERGVALLTTGGQGS